MKLTPRFALAIGLYAAVLLAAVALLAYRSGRESLRAATLSELESTASEKEAAFEEWVSEKTRDIALVAADPDIVADGLTLVEGPPGSPRARQARSAILGHMAPRSHEAEFTALLFIDPVSGVVLAATDSSEEGASKLDRPFFLQGRLGPYLQGPYISPTLESATMTAAAPVRGLDGELIGVLAGRLDLNEMTAILVRRTSRNESLDSFLVNSSAQFVTPPRFIEGLEMLTQSAETEVVDLCLLGESGHVEADDYRGEPVVAVYRWIPARELCLIVKMDQAEAFAPVAAFGRTVAGISALALLAAIGVAAALSRGLTGPILTLQTAAARYAAGERHVRMPAAQDELGDLARQWNSMAEAISGQEEALRRHAANLDAEVQERTSELKASELRLQKTMDAMREGLQIIGADWRYLYVNDAVADQGKKPKAELLGRTMMEAYPGIDQTPLFEVLREARDLQQPRRLENEFIFPDGSKGWFDLSIQPVSEGILIVSQDITERKRSEEALRLHAEQVEALNRVARIVSSSLELDNVYDDFVEELRRSLPVDRTSITRIDEPSRRWEIVRQWTAITPSLKAGTWHSLEGSFVWEVARSRRPLVESPIDPENRWTETPPLREEGMQSRIVVPLLVKDRVTGTISIASRTPNAFDEADVALVAPMAAHLSLAVENIRLYEAERQHAADLERRVAERTAELEASNEELEAFSYSVSHDLRAPLRAADGFSRILLEDFGPALGAEARRYLDLVRGSTQQMGRLIDDLLTFSRLSRQELALQPVRPSEAARRALEQLGHERTGRTVELIVDEMPEVDADSSLLVQVYANLLANALKFTRKRESASIHVGTRSVDGEPAYFVQDNGVGFDMKYASKLFGVFQRLHRAEDYEGTGVGLAIVQRIVHRHGGCAWAEGAVDQGATFYFTIPARRDR